MRSRFEPLRTQAVALRKNGASIRDIEARLGIPRSTLSGWLRDVALSKAHRAQLKRRWDEALVRARREAVVWHQKAKQERLLRIKMGAEGFVAGLKIETAGATELALAFLYLGEGAKNNTTSLGSSDVRILRFFISAVQTLYEIPLDDIKCELHLRADQNERVLVRYWSGALGVPCKNFGKSSFDKRTVGRPTYNHYKGVCIVRCGKMAIQRRLLYIADSFCEQVTGAASQGG